jgi:hypothetical protein
MNRFFFLKKKGLSSSMDTIRSFNTRSRTSLTTSQNSLSRSRIIRPPTEIYPRPIFEPLIVGAKPIHPLLFTGNTHSSKTKIKQSKTPPSSASFDGRFPYSSSLTEKCVQSSISDLSMNNNPSISSILSPHLQDVKEEEEEEKITTKKPHLIISNCSRPSSSLSLKSTIKLKSEIPRCRSANDVKHLFSLNKSYPRFILITDEEHRIESWYHQYPFIVSDDLLQTFQSKPNKSTVSAYFIDDHQQPSHSNLIMKSYLQGKSFHINNDWKKYDLIFISNNIYQQIIIYLQTIIKLSGKLIHIYQINHNEDLKTQVRYICKQLYQQILSHA